MSQRKRIRKERRREGRAVRRELNRMGVAVRAEKIRMAVREPVFATQFKDALSWAEVVPSVRTTDRIRDIALGVLRGMGLDTAGINLTVVWKPNDGRQLEFRVALMPEVAEAAISKVRDREGPRDDA